MSALLWLVYTEVPPVATELSRMISSQRDVALTACLLTTQAHALIMADSKAAAVWRFMLAHTVSCTLTTIILIWLSDNSLLSKQYHWLDVDIDLPR